jgi:LCP family protein required for cell wall assembly
MRYEDDYDDYEYSRKKRSSSTGNSRSGKSTASSGSKSRKGSSAKSGTRTAGSSGTKKSTARKSTAYYDYDYEEDELRAAEKKRNSRAEKQKKAKKKKRRLIAVVAVEAVLLAVVLAFIWVISKYDMIQKPNWGKSEVPKNTDIAEEVVQQMATGYTDIMVFGVDGVSTLESGAGADVNILVHIDNATGEVKLVSFYRDLYLNTGGNSFRKLTDIYRSDGALGAMGALNTNLDLNIEQFVTVNWASVAETINLLDGIDIDVPEEMMREINGYITETVETTGIGTTQLEGGGYQHLDGIQTVAFCRIRHINVPGYSIGDYGRTERQREVIGLLLQRAKESDLSTLLSIVDTMFPATYSNIELSDVIAMASRVTTYHIAEEDGTRGFPFNQIGLNISSSIVCSTDTVGDIQALHEYLYGTEDGYTVSQSARDIAAKLSSITGY